MAIMHRTTIDIDVHAYEQASAALGTRGYKDTVNAALSEVARSAALAKAADYVRRGQSSTPSFAELEELRSPRSGSQR